MAPQTLLRLPTVINRTGLSKSSVYQSAKNGQFPKPIRLGPRAVGWVESEIADWIDQRIQAAREA